MIQGNPSQIFNHLLITNYRTVLGGLHRLHTHSSPYVACRSRVNLIKMDGIQGTFGPLASAYNVCALVQDWRETTTSDIDLSNPNWFVTI